MKVPLWVCIVVGLACGALGFLGGVVTSKAGSEFFDDLMRTESAADIQNTETITTGFFELNYPGNWQLDREDEDFDLENYFMIESAGDSSVSFTFLHSESEPAEEIDFYVEEYLEMMRAPKVSEFSTYGSFEGVGKRIEGKVYGLGVVVDVFCGCEDGVSFTIVEWVYNEDAGDVLPGFEMIEASFSMKPEGEATEEGKVPERRPGSGKTGREERSASSE